MCFKTILVGICNVSKEFNSQHSYCASIFRTLESIHPNLCCFKKLAHVPSISRGIDFYTFSKWMNVHPKVPNVIINASKPLKFIRAYGCSKRTLVMKIISWNVYTIIKKKSYCAKKNKKGKFAPPNLPSWKSYINCLAHSNVDSVNRMAKQERSTIKNLRADN